MLNARTMTELKARMRQAMGWSDRRSWTAAERIEAQARFCIAADHRRGIFTATEKHEAAARLEKPGDPDGREKNHHRV